MFSCQICYLKIRTLKYYVSVYNCTISRNSKLFLSLSVHHLSSGVNTASCCKILFCYKTKRMRPVVINFKHCMQTKKAMPDLFKRTLLKICKGLTKERKKGKSWGVGVGSTIDPLEWKF